MLIRPYLNLWVILYPSNKRRSCSNPGLRYAVSFSSSSDSGANCLCYETGELASRQPCPLRWLRSKPSKIQSRSSWSSSYSGSLIKWSWLRSVRRTHSGCCPCPSSFFRCQAESLREPDSLHGVRTSARREARQALSGHSHYFVTFLDLQS